MISKASSSVGVAVVGAGTISDEYLGNLTCFPDLRVLVVADVVEERARSQADKFGIPVAGDLDSALTNPEVEIVANLTVPAVHAQVSCAILEAGKHVWTEKPLALDREGGQALLDLARDRGLRIGSAPDTILGRGLQASQRAIIRGDIGVPVSAITMMQDPGPESWHHSPAFIYAKGAGPLWDRGPYYLSMLTQLFGPMRRVAGLATKAFSTREIGDGPQAGATFPVDVPTNVMVLTEFESGQIAQSTYSYESALLRMGFVEVSGTEGTMAVPDPNFFDGDIYVYPSRRWTLDDLMSFQGIQPERHEWTKVPTRAGKASRGTGLLDLARSLRAETPHRASAELGYHTLDALIAITEAAETKAVVEVESCAAAPELLPDSWDPYCSTL